MNSNIQQTGPQRADDNNRSSSAIFKISRILIGSLFALTGGAKLFILDSFSRTIGQLTSLPGPICYYIALGIITLELASGFALLFNKFIRSSVLVLLGLTLTFTYFLTIAIISQHHFICNCFGIIPISLSNSSELILNFIVLDALLILYSSNGWSRYKKETGMKLIYFALAGAFLYAQYTAGAYILERDVSESPVNLASVNEFLTNYHHYPEIPPRSSHIVLIRISDFNCPPCFNDFVEYTQLVRYYYDPEHKPSQIVGLIEQSGAAADTIAIQAWGKANNIVFPLIPVPENIFRKFNFSKSCVIYQWPSGRTRYLYTFPGSDPDRKKLMAAFSE